MNKKSKIFGALAVGVLLLSSAIPSQAIAIVLQSGNTATGDQAYSGVGVKFTVNEKIRVTDLGIFDADQDGFVATRDNPLTASLFSGAVLLAQQSFWDASPGTSDGNYNFKSIAELILTPGDYVLAGYGWTTDDFEYNCSGNSSTTCEIFNSGGGLVTLIGSVWSSPQNSDPDIVPTGGAGTPNYFSAANMKYEQVPEPGAIAIFGFGLAGLGLMRRRKRVAA